MPARLPPEIADALTRLAELAVRNSVGAVRTRIQAVRSQKDAETTASELNEIIDELLDEKTELVSIARSLEEQLVAQRISDEELSFITDELVPRLDKLMRGEPGLDAGEVDKQMETGKELLSKETLSILQLVGFNYKTAIGLPLTNVVANLISQAVPSTGVAEEVQLLQARREILYLEIAKDPSASERLSALFGGFSNEHHDQV